MAPFLPTSLFQALFIPVLTLKVKDILKHVVKKKNHSLKKNTAQTWDDK